MISSRAFARRFLSRNSAAAKLSSKEAFERLIANSKVSNQSSNKRLEEVVENINGEIQNHGGLKRVMFTNIQFNTRVFVRHAWNALMGF